MHRGGTSTIARSLKAIGVELGDHLVTPHASDNSRGYWEDYEVYGLSERLLGAIGLRWDSLEDFTLAPWQSDTVAVLRNEAEQLLRQRLGAWHSWGFKDPRTARLLDFWQPVFQHVGTPVQYVIAVRNPLSVSRSLARRDGYETEKSLLLWLLHMFPATVKTADEFTVFVDYDLLLDRPREQVERIREKLSWTANFALWAAVALGVAAAAFAAWPALGRVLLAYATAARVPVAVVMAAAIWRNWGTHYDLPPPGFTPMLPLRRWLWTGLLPQATVWVAWTSATGALAGALGARAARRRL